MVRVLVNWWAYTWGGTTYIWRFEVCRLNVFLSFSYCFEGQTFVNNYYNYLCFKVLFLIVLNQYFLGKMRFVQVVSNEFSLEFNFQNSGKKLNVYRKVCLLPSQF